MGITLMEALEKAGYPREQMFNHNSDLYVFVTPVLNCRNFWQARSTATMYLGTFSRIAILAFSILIAIWRTKVWSVSLQERMHGMA